MAKANQAIEDPSSPLSHMRALWKTTKPEKSDYGKVLNELTATDAIGEGSLFTRGKHTPVTHMGFFLPPMDAFLTDLKAKDRRSAKEWEYVNSAAVWLETGLSGLTVLRTEPSSAEVSARLLVLAEQSFKVAYEVLCMRAQYFREITTEGIDQARQMAFLVEQKQEVVHSSAYKAAREILSAKIEIETAKNIARARASGGAVNNGKGKKKKKGGATDATDSE